MSKSYMVYNLNIFVPILTLEGPPHWFGTEVNMMSKLSTLDLLCDENKSNLIDNKDHGLPQQDNDRDCGIYVMKYMEAVANEEDPVAQFSTVVCLHLFANQLASHGLTRLSEVWKSLQDWRTIQGSSFASSSTPLRSPSKSPCDPQFRTPKFRQANMFPPSRASLGFRSSKNKISYVCLLEQLSPYVCLLKNSSPYHYRTWVIVS
ncbi:hypothetical protein F8388_004616 [Cannabis sativa]|uniref:Ubiquitin-like protease family profile domain-containing protein n=1 Tax=Cannabis sativa TaxID=3483 RepID=A0A7J6GN95_CANSA|nr:hypothetical protein F8388_004616 [Cannabis sativa]